MSNLQPNPFNLRPSQDSPRVPLHEQQYGQVPLNQLPPGIGSIKQDANSNSPIHMSTQPQQSTLTGQANNYSNSASSSPAFNRQAMISPQSVIPSSHIRPLKPIQQITPNSMQPNLNQLQSLTSNQNAPSIATNALPILNPNQIPPTSYPPVISSQSQQINNNAAPVIPSSQPPRPILNGPPGSRPMSVPTVSFPPTNPISSTNLQTLTTIKPPTSAIYQSQPPSNQSVGFSQASSATVVNSTSAPPQSFPSRVIPSSQGTPTSGTYGSQQVTGLPKPVGINGSSSSNDVAQTNTYMGAPISGLPVVSGPGKQPYNAPHSLAPTGQPVTGMGIMNQPTSLYNGPQMPGPPPKFIGSVNSPYQSTAQNLQPVMQSALPNRSMNVPSAGPQVSLPPNPAVLNTLPNRPMNMPPTGSHIGPSIQGVPPSNNIQGRYPQTTQNYVNHQTQQLPAQVGLNRQYPQQYNTQPLAQQMGNLSVTKQGFDQLWGHQMIDLLQCRHILPEYPEDPPPIKLGHHFADSSNCSPEIFRCTINRIPETNNLLQKSRLPLGILIHPFKDLNHLPVIQCNTIVRCRACRTYINPFVYFVDAKRWKCNLCYRVNDLPEEFQYDPVSKSYGDPSRRPEIKSATIEFIAPGEYMLRPPQPAVYLFLMDVSQIGRDSGYLQVLCETLKNCLDQLPGDARTQVGFICYDAHIHYYVMGDGFARPKEMTVLDVDDVFLPSPESLLVNLGERRELVDELLSLLPQRHSTPGVPASALGAALQAAYKLMAPTGGRITVFQTCLPNLGPGALQSREDPNARSAKDVNHLNPATDFYKRLALDCSGAQISMDLFLLSSQYSDLATLSGMSKFSGGTVYHIPVFRASRPWQAEQFKHMLNRYLTRKIGFEAVMRVRCTRGITIHTFHGNFFVRSTDLLSLPNVSPDAGFGMQLAIEESLSDLQQVCFQAALLYTSSKGERRIRVHTMALPIASNLTDVLHSADQLCIIGLLSKMAVDRSMSASLSESREALMNVSVEALSAHRLAQNLPAGSVSAALHAPVSLRLLPLYISALLKRKAFRTGTSTRLDDRVADMCDIKTLPLPQLLRGVYPDLYPIHTLREYQPKPEDDEDDTSPDPPRMQLSAERINSHGAYLLDDGETMMIYVCHAVSPAFLSDTFGVTAFSQLPDESRTLPSIQSEGNELLHAFVDKLNDDRPYPSNILILRDNSSCRQMFIEKLVDDRVESSFSYYEFLQHVKSQVK